MDRISLLCIFQVSDTTADNLNIMKRYWSNFQFWIKFCEMMFNAVLKYCIGMQTARLAGLIKHPNCGNTSLIDILLAKFNDALSRGIKWAGRRSRGYWLRAPRSLSLPEAALDPRHMTQTKLRLQSAFHFTWHISRPAICLLSWKDFCLILMCRMHTGCSINSVRNRSLVQKLILKRHVHNNCFRSAL